MANKKVKYRFLRRFAKFVLALLSFFILLILLIRSPWAQNFIVDKATNYISDKTNTKVEINRLFITFSGNAFLEGLYLEDKKGDTLLYTKSLEANVPLSPLLFQNELNLKFLKWKGLKANITRTAGSDKFNYQFLLDALIPKDTASQQVAAEPMQISMGELELSDFLINYIDDQAGMEAKLNMGTLSLYVNKVDIETMHYEVDELALSNTNVRFKQTKPFDTADNPEIQLPFLAVDKLKISNVKVEYNSLPDDIVATVLLGEFNLDLPKADLAKNEVELESLTLKDSDIFVQFYKDDLATGNTAESQSNEVSFLWPDFLIKADEIDLANNSFQYQVKGSLSDEGQFDPNHIFLSGLTLRARDLSYQRKNAKLTLDQFSFREKGGFSLNQLAMDARFTDTSISLSDLELRTGSSSIMGNLMLDYPSVQQIIDSPKSTAINFQLKDLKLALQEALFFQPKLAENEYFNKIQQHPISGSLNIKGTIESLQIPTLNLKWNNTALVGTGNVYRITETDYFSFDISNIEGRSNKNDLKLFVDEENLSIVLPETIVVEAQAKGSLKSVSGEAKMKIPEGTAKVVGNFSNSSTIDFDGNLEVDDLQLGKLFKNESLGTTSFTLTASGNGRSLNTLNAKIESNFTQLSLKNYDFSNLDISGQVSNGNGNINLNFKDNNLNFTSNTTLNLESESSQFRLNLKVIGADLQALGLTTENIKVGLEMDAEFIGNPKNYAFDTSVKNGIVVFGGEQYQMGDIQIKSKIDTIRTEVSIDSDFLNGNLLSNASPQGINNSLTQYFKNYLQDTAPNRSPKDSLKLHMDLKLTPNPILTKVFFRDLEQLDSIIASVNYEALTKNLNSEIHIPYVRYKGVTLDSLNFSVTGDSTDLNFKAGLANLLADPVKIGRTYFEGQLINKELFLDFISYSGKEKVAHIASEMTLANDTTLIHINPIGLLLNKEEWSIPKDNRISLAQDYLEFQNIKLKRNTQELSLVSSSSNAAEKHLDLTFKQFKLQTFLCLLNADQPLVSGVVNGDFTVENPFGATGLVADFNLNELAVLEHPLGNLSLNAKSKSKKTYDFELSLKGGGADLELFGDYAAAETGAQLNLDLDLNRLDLALIEDFSKGALKDSGGNISGNMEVSGTTVTPVYNGMFNFNDTNFNVATLNSVFRISDETLKIDNQGLYLDNFEISDANGNIFNMNGSIGTEDVINPNFDLRLKAEQFQALNSTEADNELFYGIASFDFDLSVNGNLKLPEIEGKVRVRKVTDITYVVPKEQLDVQEREGVVLFVNRENPDAILTRNEEEETPTIFSGIDTKVIMEVADDADFHIIIDERTGDNLEVSGNGSFNLNIEPNGRTSLTGRYELSSGYYETSLYNLVKRRFEINPGGTITWEGNPMDAKLDVTATYRVETSAAPLMAAVTSGEDISVTSKYRQVLPFLVYLNVDGELLQPKLSFGLDIPEKEQGSLGGAVYGRVQQLNQQEAELNKQVFSLLALNRFYPSSGSDGSLGGTAALARDNVNKVLSGQLNAFSDKIFGTSGFEVDFDLDSFTDYQGESPQERTQLDINAKKKLFDDRLVVTAGSAVDVEGSAQPGQEETPIIGNVSLEYLLTKDGRYRLRGFRKNEYANIIDGQLIVTGIALIFNREFNKFSQLFNPLKDSNNKDDNKKGDNNKE